ncbi:DUF3867 domain-containing protein [Clostridium sp. YIM B02505]|uniref:DUF3867 domain-containing protein n=1 Tax=Clostridium yunnanense TaxID=2800325 RepID=A0ABS1EL37_9CLOT|nr:DUF3867 domain-containing protein [Clostridium yunnanense]MBK1810077.1 DUF3867 domain-containing protein [Clostridium yunnanense]
MDDKIVDFNELKNKAKDKDVDKFEDYIYGLYYSVAQGTLSMADFTTKIMKYMEENDISQEKFFNMQKKLMERYGFDSSFLENQAKILGINPNSVGNLGAGQNYEAMRKTISFTEKYKGKTVPKSVLTYSISNKSNELDLILEGDIVILKSNKKIDLKDVELNEFLCSYKKLQDDKNLKISICENVGEYEY